MSTEPQLADIVALAKRRGFVYPGSEIYGGLANTYDYGPLGSELLRNIKNLWWNTFVNRRPDIVGLDTSILMSPKVWEASGHTASFTDALVDCKACQTRTRADHLIENFLSSKNQPATVEGYTPSQLDALITEHLIPCPNCGEVDWTPVRHFNLLFETHIGIVSESQSLAYLRGEIAQGMFVNFKNVLDSTRLKLPFGLAQSGAAFRNEITLGNFIFRTLQFNLSEFEYFFDPEATKWETLFDYWKQQMWTWCTEGLGLSSEKLRWRQHTDEERSHYSLRTEDIEYQFSFGFKEMYGLAYRTDYDLRNHMAKSGVDIQYTDAKDPSRKFIPHVIEPTFGMDRTFLAVLFDSYTVDTSGNKPRPFLKLKPQLAPYKVAVFPLLANKPELVDKAHGLFTQLLSRYTAIWDDRGNIGKRYFAQDEIGTPWCITVDFQTLEDDTVTVRDRDTASQQRLPISQLDSYLANHLV